MDKQGFQRFLKKSGKKAHVVEGLINQAQAYEVYLTDKQQNNVEAANEQNLRDYVKGLPQKKVKRQMRALALYFRFMGNASLARLSSDLREQEIAKTRKSFKLREFRGVSLEEIAKLETAGIITVEHMLNAGKTPRARRQLAEQMNISPQTILELVKLSDLSRLGAVKRVRARLYYDAGIETPDKFTQWEPEALKQMLDEFVQRTGFDGIAPQPKEVQYTITKARQLPKAVQY